MSFSVASNSAPQVYISETDLTTSPISVTGNAGAFAGQFAWGPVLQNVLIGSEGDLVNMFGKPGPNTSTSFYTCANFLAYSGSLNVVRVCNAAAKNATADGTGLYIPNLDQYNQQYGNGQAEVGNWAAKYPGELGNGLIVSLADAGNFGSWAYASYFSSAPGTTSYAKNVGGKNDEVHVVVIDGTGAWTGVPGSLLEAYAYLSKGYDNKAEDGTSNYFPTVINRKSQYVWWMDFPTQGTNWGTASSTTFVVLSGTLVINGGTGTYQVNENVNVFSGGLSAINVTAAGTGYNSAPTVTISGNGTGATATATIASGGVTGIIVTNAGSGYTAPPTVTLSGGAGTGATATAVVNYSTYPTKSGKVTAVNSGTITILATKGSINTTDLVVGATSSATGVPSSVTNIVVKDTLAGGVSANSLMTPAQRTVGYDLFNNTNTVSCSFVLGGECDSVLANYIIDSVAEVRQDCVAFISPQFTDVVNNPKNELNAITAFRNSITDSSYAFFSSNWKYQYDKYNDIYVWTPDNGDVAGLAAASFVSTAPWYSFAGFNRGLIKNVFKFAWQPQKTEMNALYNLSINPVYISKGNGPVLWGDRTLLSKPSQFRAVNVRYLFIVLETTVSRYAEYSMFELNDTFSQNQFVSSITPFLQEVQGQRGISDFKIVCDDTNNTPSVIASQGFVGDIYVKPISSINYIQLNFVAVGNTVSFTQKIGQ